MKNALLFAALFFFLCVKAQNAEELNRPYGFIENKGQVVDQSGAPRPDVLFTFSGQGMTVQIKKNGFSYSLFTEKKKSTAGETAESIFPKTSVTVQRVDVSLVGANLSPEVIAEGQSADVVNYFTGGGTVKGITGIHHYRKITLKNIYPLTDLVFYTSDEKGLVMKYDFVIHPGGDPSQIKMRYEGADKLSLLNESLQIFTPAGKIVEHIPLCYQLNSENKKQAVPCSYSVKGNTVTFVIDPAKLAPESTTVIDPTISRIWGTYYGRQGFDWFYDIVTDSSSNILACGASGYGSTSLATSGAYQYTSAGQSDALLVKFDSAGTRLWATYFGGTGDDNFNAIRLDASGHIIIAGSTESASGIATANAWQPVFGGGTLDAFITRFDANGFPEWSTYIGGPADEYLLCVTLDSHDNIYAGGFTSSTSGIASPGAFQPVYGGGTWDGFVVRVDSSGNLVWSTYYGGTATDQVYGIDLIDDSLLFFDGNSTSTNGIATAGSYQPVYAGSNDAFLAKFDTAGTQKWATYYGGPAADGFKGISHNSSGQIIVTGSSTSTSGIASPGAFQTSSSGSEAMIVVFNADGTRYWATYYGGLDTEAGYDIAIDSQDYIVASGRTMSPTGIATPGAWQTVHASYTAIGSDKLDGYIVKFSPSGSRIWGTYYGGDHDEEGKALTIDAQGRILLCGNTGSTINMASANAFQTAFYNSWEGYIARFDQLIINTDSISSPFCAGSTISVSFNAYGNFGPTNTFNAQLSNSSGSFASPVNIGTITGVTTGTITATIPPSTAAGSGYRIRVFSVDRGVADSDNGSNLTIWPLPTVSIAIFPVICIDDPVIPLPQLTPGGQPAGGTFSGPGIDTAGNFDPLAAGPGIHTVYYTYTDIHNCATQTDSQLVNVSTHTSVSFNPIPSVCAGSAPFTLTQGQPSGGTYFGTGVISGTQFDPSVSGTGTFTITYLYVTNGVCYDTASQTIIVYPAPPAPLITNNSDLLSTTAAGSLQWLLNSNPIPGATSSSWQATQNGSYQVSVTDANGCTSVSAPLVINDVGIQSLFYTNATVSVFPNPFKNYLQLNLDIKTSSSLSIKLFDISGRECSVLFEKSSFQAGKYSEQIGTGNELSPGIYFLRIELNGEINWLRIMKE